MNKMEIEQIILQYTESIFGYCIKRLNDIQDAQDLSQEILVECIRFLSNREDILNYDAYIWKTAHNRYARRFYSNKITCISLQDSGLDMCLPDYSDFERLENQDTINEVFRAVAGIAKSHREVLVDYYVKELSYSEIAEKREISINTVKTRLFYGKQKLKERFDKVMSENQKVYERINWHIMCNGHMDPNKYLDKQVSRAICLAAYDKPLSIEKISDITGMPCMYIEDEINSLIYGEAIEKIGSKYQTNFIIHTKTMMDKTLLSLKDKADEISYKLFNKLKQYEEKIRNVGFYGCHFTMEHLLWIFIPLTIRAAVYNTRQIVPQIHYEVFPPRKDGGCGYFVIQESENERVETNSGCNCYRNGNKWDKLYNYFWWGKHFNSNINNILPRAVNMNFSNGIFDFSILPEEDLALLIKYNLVYRNNENKDCWSIPVFTEKQYKELENILNKIAEEFVLIIAEAAEKIYRIYENLIPKRLYSQISGVMGGEVHRIIGLIIENYISNGYLKEPNEEFFTKQVLMIVT